VFEIYDAETQKLMRMLDDQLFQGTTEQRSIERHTTKTSVLRARLARRRLHDLKGEADTIFIVGRNINRLRR
jgi:hypothetical protein